jgi:nucleoside recognition membrane protein YjiH
MCTMFSTAFIRTNTHLILKEGDRGEKIHLQSAQTNSSDFFSWKVFLYRSIRCALKTVYTYIIVCTFTLIEKLLTLFRINKKPKYLRKELPANQENKAPNTTHKRQN